MPRHACRIATVAHLGSDSTELRKFSHARHSPRAAKYGSRVISFKLLLFASAAVRLRSCRLLGGYAYNSAVVASFVNERRRPFGNLLWTWHLMSLSVLHCYCSGQAATDLVSQRTDSGG